MKKKYNYYVSFQYRSDKKSGFGGVDIAYGNICSHRDVTELQKEAERRLITNGCVSPDVRVVILNWTKYDQNDELPIKDNADKEVINHYKDLVKGVTTVNWEDTVSKWDGKSSNYPV